MDTTVLAAVVSVLAALTAASTAVVTLFLSQRWNEKRDDARDRREAYCGYLVAQQGLRDEMRIRELRTASQSTSAARQHDPAADDHDAEGQDRLGPLAASKVWRESGAAEMNARLVASASVLDAIDAFEVFADAYTRAFEEKAELPGCWEDERHTLIQAMRDESDPRGDRATRAIRQAPRPSLPRASEPAEQRRVTVPIETARLTLRAYEPADVDDIHALLYGDAQVRQYTGGVSTREETRAQIQHYIDAQHTNGYAYWAVIERESRTLVGEAGLKPLNDVGPDVELGYAFGKTYWRRGFATEAASAIIDAASADLGLRHLFATVEPGNSRSRRVLTNLSFSPAGSTADNRLLCFRLDLPRAPGGTAQGA